MPNFYILHGIQQYIIQFKFTIISLNLVAVQFCIWFTYERQSRALDTIVKLQSLFIYSPLRRAFRTYATLISLYYLSFIIKNK